MGEDESRRRRRIGVMPEQVENKEGEITGRLDGKCGGLRKVVKEAEIGEGGSMEGH
jgi:hypothetical protein